MKSTAHRWRNAFPANPTQTVLRRFERMPWGEMRSAFTDSQESFERVGRDVLKTRYDDMWRGQDNDRF